MVTRMLLDVTNDDEEASFWILAGLVDKYDMSEMWKKGMKQLEFCFFTLNRLISIYLPGLSRHFASEGIHLNMFASRWFLALFCSDDVISKEVTRKLWDIFIVEKWPVVFSTCLSILTLLEKDLMKEDFEGMLKLLGHVKERLDEREEQGEWQLLARAVGEFALEDAVVKDIQAEYWLERDKN